MSSAGSLLISNNGRKYMQPEGAMDLSKSLASIFLPVGMLGRNNVPEEFFIISKPTPSKEPQSKVANSFSNCLSSQCRFISNPVMTLPFFSSSTFSVFVGIRSLSIITTTTSRYGVRCQWSTSRS